MMPRDWLPGTLHVHYTQIWCTDMVPRICSGFKEVIASTANMMRTVSRKLTRSAAHRATSMAGDRLPQARLRRTPRNDHIHQDTPTHSKCVWCLRTVATQAWHTPGACSARPSCDRPCLVLPACTPMAIWPLHTACSRSAYSDLGRKHGVRDAESAAGWAAKLGFPLFPPSGVPFEGSDPLRVAYRKRFAGEIYHLPRMRLAMLVSSGIQPNLSQACGKTCACLMQGPRHRNDGFQCRQDQPCRVLRIFWARRPGRRHEPVSLRRRSLAKVAFARVACCHCNAL